MTLEEQNKLIDLFRKNIRKEYHDPISGDTPRVVYIATDILIKILIELNEEEDDN